MVIERDVLIIGAGPIGLSLACALAEAGFSVALIERQPRSTLAAPTLDGREIALTSRAQAILRSVGIWARLPSEEISPICEARVLDATSTHYLGFSAQDRSVVALGHLVPNAAIRKAAYEAALAYASVALLDGVGVDQVSVSATAAEVRLGEGSVLRSRLIVAADSRFSETRRRMGIGAEMRDFGRTAIVCRMVSERPHDQIAYECFGTGRTLAVLPLNGGMVSAVVTARNADAATLMKLPDGDYAALICEQFDARLGGMQLVGERYAYPLVAVYAHRFIAHRFALAGDAAVGMHPVTAHGFNLGLYGVEALVRALLRGRASGWDAGSLQALRPYQAEHRRQTLPIYAATNAIVGLFTDDRLPSRAIRKVVLRIVDRVPPIKSAITRQVTGATSWLRAGLVSRKFFRESAATFARRSRAGGRP